MHKRIIIPVVIAVFTLTASPRLLAQGCCGGGATKTGCGMASANTSDSCGHEAQAGAARQSSVPRAVLPSPVQAIFDGYLKVLPALTQGSLAAVHENASALAKALQKDSDDVLPAKVTQQADALAKAQS